MLCAVPQTHIPSALQDHGTPMSWSARGCFRRLTVLYVHHPPSPGKKEKKRKPRENSPENSKHRALALGWGGGGHRGRRLGPPRVKRSSAPRRTRPRMMCKNASSSQHRHHTRTGVTVASSAVAGWLVSRADEGESGRLNNPYSKQSVLNRSEERSFGDVGRYEWLRGIVPAAVQ